MLFEIDKYYSLCTILLIINKKYTLLINITCYGQMLFDMDKHCSLWINIYCRLNITNYVQSITLKKITACNFLYYSAT